MMSVDDSLRPADVALHARLGIDAALLAAAGVRRVTHQQAIADCGIRYRSDHLEGIWYPSRDPERGDERSGRVRRDHPELDRDGKPITKYVAPPDRHYLYFAPGAGPVLGDTSITVVMVEAEKSALALTAAATRANRRLFAIGLGGCYGWKGTIGKTTDAAGARVDERGPLPDLDRVTWRDRDVVVLFDANAATNRKVQAARRALASELAGRGARVRIAELPVEDGMNGPDDYVAKHGEAALFAVIDAAKPARRSQDLPIADLLNEFELTAEAVRDVTPDVLDGRLRALAVALTGADRLRRALVAAELKKTAKLPAAIVSAALDTRDDEPDKAGMHTIALSDDEPAPEPVNGAGLLDEMAALIRRHIVLSPAQADAIALWAAATYTIDALSVMAILLITAPTMRSGKTTLLLLLAALVRRALAASNVTGAVLVRVIAAHQPTLLLDEADSWLQSDDDDMRGLLNAGEYRQTAYVLRCAPDTHEPQAIACFAARALAMIGRPTGRGATLCDRSIIIELRRKRADETVERMRLDRLTDDHRMIRRQWRRWADDHRDEIRESAATLPEAAIPGALTSDRARSHWRPLLALAHHVGADWPARACAAAVELSGAADEFIHVELLRDVHVVFEERGDQPIASADLAAALVAMTDRPWAAWGKYERPITPAALARALVGFGIHPMKIRFGAKTANGYTALMFADAWSRYMPIEPEHRNTPNNDGGKPPLSQVEQPIECSGSENAVLTNNDGLCSSVPVETPDLRTEGEDATVDRPDLLWRNAEEREQEAEEWRLP